LNELSLALTKRFQICNTRNNKTPRAFYQQVRLAEEKYIFYYRLCQALNIPSLEIERTCLEALPPKGRQRYFTMLPHSLTHDECQNLAKEFNLKFKPK